jgi:5-methylcytosine-specific restriction endonuclease McrA
MRGHKYLICEYCGKEFTGRKRKFCSSECRKLSERKHKSLNPQSDYKRTVWIRDNIPDGFLLVGKYEGGNSIIKLKCIRCGNIIEGKIDSFRRHKTVRCSNCFKDKRSKYGNKSDYLDAMRTKREEREKEIINHKHINIYKRKCVECGVEFETTQINQKTCSDKCRKRWRNRNNDRRINKGNTIDKDITLATLYERDKGICYMCGCKCDWDDKKEIDGFFKVGKAYPSIDHIIPLSRGGKHSWDNIRLACHHCNSIKSDKNPLEIFGDKYNQVLPKDPYIFARKDRARKKEVYQYMRDGTFISKYESTVAAERETGYKKKQIQNCARGERKTYKNFIWTYNLIGA